MLIELLSPLPLSNYCIRIQSDICNTTSLSLSVSLFPALGTWEKFEDTHQVSKKLLSSVSGGGEEAGSGGGAVCAADAMVSDSQWTALDDSRHRELFGMWQRSINHYNMSTVSALLVGLAVECLYYECFKSTLPLYMYIITNCSCSLTRIACKQPTVIPLSSSEHADCLPYSTYTSQTGLSISALTTA